MRLGGPDPGFEGKAAKLAFAYSPSHADGVFTAAHFAALEQLCTVVDPVPLERFDDARGRAALASADILVTGWGAPRIDATVLKLAPHLKLIAHAAGTVKSLVTPEVFAAGVSVCNAVTANALPVAEFTLATILFSNKRVLAYRDRYRRERDTTRWEMLTDPALGNWHKCIGIVGCSRIGRRVIELLQPFDFEVLVHDPYFSAEEAERMGVEAVDLDLLMARADVVTLHAPLLDSTRHMIDARRLTLMRDGTTLINTARGGLIEQAALERELASGRLYAVLDVTTPDPLPATSPLYDLPNVLLTPHIAGAFGSERERLGALVVAEVERFVRGAPLLHAVQPETLHLQA